MKKIIENYLYNLGYQILTVFIPFISIPYVTRVLGPNYLGIQSYSLSVIAIFLAFSISGTSTYSTRVIAKLRNDKKELPKAAYNIVFVRTTLGSLITLVYLVFSSFSEYGNFLFLQVFYLLGSTLFDFTWYYTGMERFKELTLRNLIVKIVGFLLTILLVKEKSDFYIYIIITGLTVLLPNIYFMIRFFMDIGFPKKEYFSFLNTKKLINSMLPLFIMGIVIQVYMNIDKIILEQNNLTYQLGIYTQMVSSYNTFLSPITAIGTILMPYVSNVRYQQKNNIDKIILRSTNIIFLMGIPLFLGLIFIAKQFVEGFFGYDFTNYVQLFRIGCFLILTGSLSNIIIQQIILPNMKDKTYLFGLTLASLVRILLLGVFINNYGIYSAMVAYIVSEVFILIWCGYFSRKTINILPIVFNINNLKIIISGIIMFLSLSILHKGTDIIVNVLLGISIYFIPLIVLREKITVSLINYILKRKENEG